MIGLEKFVPESLAYLEPHIQSSNSEEELVSRQCLQVWHILYNGESLFRGILDLHLLLCPRFFLSSFSSSSSLSKKFFFNKASTINSQHSIGNYLYRSLQDVTLCIFTLTKSAQPIIFAIKVSRCHFGILIQCWFYYPLSVWKSSVNL